MITGVRFGGTVIYEAATLDEARHNADKIRQNNRYVLMSEPELTPIHKEKVSIYGHILKAITGSDALNLIRQLGVRVKGGDTAKQIESEVQKALARLHGSQEVGQAKKRLVDAAVELNKVLGKPITYHKVNTTR
jgi:hypothetical protein